MGGAVDERGRAAAGGGPGAGWGPQVSAGLLAVVVGFTSSFAVVLAGLRGVGATAPQAASALAAMCVLQGLAMAWLSWRTRMPVSLAWSTPGAALLAGAGAAVTGFDEAVGAFLVAAGLTVLAAAWPALSRAVLAIPRPLASGMLAGVLLPLCLAPVPAIADDPLRLAPVVLVWALALRFAPPWATPLALVVVLVEVAVLLATGGVPLPEAGALLPAPALVAPAWSTSALVGVALPLFVVTMAGQNVPGAAVMAVHGYAVPLRRVLLVTGAGSGAGALLGGLGMNLAAITAALCAGPDAGPDPARRWRAPVVAGAGYVVVGLVAGAVAIVVASAPAGLVAVLAGVALVGALTGGLQGVAAAPTPGARTAAVLTTVVAASGVTVAGVGAAAWALVVGGVLWRLLVPRAAAADPTPSPDPGPSPSAVGSPVRE